MILFQKLKNYIISELISNDESKQSLLEMKKYGKLQLNNKQRDALFKVNSEAKFFRLTVN